MKYFSCLIALSVIFLQSCKNFNSEISEVKLIPVKNGDVYEYIDRDGKIVINPQFADATVFRDGVALVSNSGDHPKWGYIDENGKYLINPTYKDATIFSEGLAWVVAENSAPKAINLKGEIKITLLDALKVRAFKEGLAAFSVADSGGEKWGYVNTDGTIKINPQFFLASDFSDGKAGVKNKEGKCGFIDKDGKIVINYQFDDARRFRNKFAVVAFGGKCGVIDQNGKYTINPQFSEIYDDNGLFVTKQDGKYGWCDNGGKIIINPQFEDVSFFVNNDLAPVKSGNSYGYVNNEGKMMINCQFDEAGCFNGGLACVKSGGKYGFIDKNGKYVINPQFDRVAFDYYYYITGGATSHGEIETDYFNIDAIVGRIRKDVTDKDVAGLNLKTPISAVMSKYNKSQDDFSKYSSETVLINNEKLSNDASMSFYVLGSPWIKSSSGWYGYNYDFKSDYVPVGFAYKIFLKNKAKGKGRDIVKGIRDIFSGYVTDESKSKDNVVALKNSSQYVFIVDESKSNDIIVVVEPLSNFEVAGDSDAAEPVIDKTSY